jgi:4-alpha-glucanotransferase
MTPTRHAGVLAPLSAMASRESWGIGEFPDLGSFSEWLAEAGFDRLMLLPIFMTAASDHSPYAVSSAMALDPIYIATGALRDFVGAGGTSAMSAAGRDALVLARDATAIDYRRVRAARQEALALAFERFVSEEWRPRTARAETFRAWADRERLWLDDHALFQALSESRARAPWWEWDPPLRTRDPAALDDARREHATSLLRHQHAQWLADTQWQAARGAARDRGVTVIGDLPFAVSADSADVWAHQDLFDREISIGAPPDAFSATGQDWGLPFYRWDVLARTDYEWIRQRVRRMAALFDGLRIDHLVGLYRTYGIPREGAPFFSPPYEDEAAQVRQGEALLRIFLESGLAIIAEDLGTVPDAVRESMARLGIPGTKVLRWERAWHHHEQPFRDPATFPPTSAAMSGTHYTEPLPLWWDRASVEERRAVLGQPAFAELAPGGDGQPWSDALRDACLRQLYAAGSDDVFLPLQDLFGWRDRINTPATVGDANWTWRLPWPVDRWAAVPEAAGRARFSRALATETGRHLRGW